MGPVSAAIPPFPIAKIGSPEKPAATQNATTAAPNLGPKKTPVNVTANVCIVIGTGPTGTATCDDAVKTAKAIKAANDFSKNCALSVNRRCVCAETTDTFFSVKKG